MCLAGVSWSFDRASANLKEFCGLVVCDNTIRKVCHEHGGALQPWQEDHPDARRAFREASGDIEFQTDGTSVNTTGGWREIRLSLLAKRQRGTPGVDRTDEPERGVPTPHVRVIQASLQSGEQLGACRSQRAERLGITDPATITVLAEGARWIGGQVADHWPGAAGVLDIYHARARLWDAANRHFGEGTAAARTWVTEQRGALLQSGAAGLLAALPATGWDIVRGYFEPHLEHTGYAERLERGQSIGSGMAEGACKQVIGRRLKQTGARWTVQRAERMATLCAVQASEQWATYWNAAA